MKKILALCLTLVLVVSMSLTALAVTITVPANTVFNQSFAGLSAETFPSDWTITGNGHTFLDGGINPGHHVNVGATGVRYNDTFDAGKADYTFTVNFAHYNNTQYIHFGADTAADAIKHGAGTGYTFTATMGSEGKGGVYKLYKNGTEMDVTLTDNNASGWNYQKVREFSFTVTDDAVIVSGPFVDSPITVADAEPVKSGYVGASLACNASSTVPLLNAMKLTCAEYSYDVEADETDTGAYVVLGTEYSESHEGTLYVNQSFAGLTADTVPAGISVPTENITYATDYVQLTAFKDATVSLGTKTIDEGAWTVEAKYAATNESNKVIFNFLGYKLHSGKNDGGFELYQGSTLLAEKDTTAVSSWGNGSLNTVKVTYADGKMNVYVDNTLVFENVEIATPTYSGTLSINNSYSGATKIYYIKIYTPDYKDTSSYVDQTRSNFLFERVFTSENTTIADLRAQGYSVTASGIDADGLYTTEGQVTVEYTKYPFKGAYTIETKASGGYKNPETITFNKTTGGDYYCLNTLGGSWSLYKYQNAAKTVLADNTTTVADDDAFFYKNPRTYKIILTPGKDAEENATLSIGVYLNGTECVTVTDTAPITEKGTVKVTTGYNKPAYLHYIKVYPNGTAPAYSGSFVVDGAPAEAYAKGNTLFTFPVAMIGNEPAIVAALYEDNEMTDVKIIGVDVLNVGVAELFDTTKSTATKACIKVFMWNSIEGMVPVFDPFVLE